jgi:hypothetical protein
MENVIEKYSLFFWFNMFYGDQCLFGVGTRLSKNKKSLDIQGFRGMTCSGLEPPPPILSRWFSPS